MQYLAKDAVFILENMLRSTMLKRDSAMREDDEALSDYYAIQENALSDALSRVKKGVAHH